MIESVCRLDVFSRPILGRDCLWLSGRSKVSKSSIVLLGAVEHDNMCFFIRHVPR